MNKPVTLRVRLAFGSYRVGYLFKSPPLPGTLRQDWISRGLVEVVPEETATKDKRKKSK